MTGCAGFHLSILRNSPTCEQYIHTLLYTVPMYHYYTRQSFKLLYPNPVSFH